MRSFGERITDFLTNEGIWVTEQDLVKKKSWPFGDRDAENKGLTALRMRHL